MAATRKGVKFPSKSLAAFAKKASRFRENSLLKALLQRVEGIDQRTMCLVAPTDYGRCRPLVERVNDIEAGNKTRRDKLIDLQARVEALEKGWSDAATDPKPDDADRVVLTGEQFAKWMRSTQTLADEDRPGSFPPREAFGHWVHEDDHRLVLNDNLRLARENAELTRRLAAELERRQHPLIEPQPRFDHVGASSN